MQHCPLPSNSALSARPAATRLACVVLALVMSAASATPLHAQPADYRSVVPANAQSQRGLFHVHMVGGRLLFEIPDSILGRDMSVMSRYAQSQTELANGGDRMAPNMVVRWERRDNTVYLRAISHENTADEGTPLHVAVENSNFAPVLQAFPLRARGDGTSVIDATDMYLGDTPAFSLPRQQRTRFGVRSHDRARTWLEWARTFPINVELRVVQTYNADTPPSSARGGTLSFAVNHSMVLLPKKPMQPRLYRRARWVHLDRTHELFERLSGCASRTIHRALSSRTERHRGIPAR